MLRRNTFLAWIAAGWPQWTVAKLEDYRGPDAIETPDHFSEWLNEMLAFCNLSVVFCSILPGMLVDFFHRKLVPDYKACSPNESYGTGVGLTLCFSIFIGLFGSTSILSAIRMKETAMGAVILFVLGRIFGGLFASLIFYLFPANRFGLIFGSAKLIGTGLQMLLFPMFTYISSTNDYSLMNYLLASLLMTGIIVPITIMKRAKINKVKRGKIDATRLSMKKWDNLEYQVVIASINSVCSNRGDMEILE